MPEDSELLMALLVECLSLVPGSVVVEASAADRVLWAHVLGADDEAGVARFRRQVDRLVADLLAAGGRYAELYRTQFDDRPAEPAGEAVPAG